MVKLVVIEYMNARRYTAVKSWLEIIYVNTHRIISWSFSAKFIKILNYKYEGMFKSMYQHLNVILQVIFINIRRDSKETKTRFVYEVSFLNQL